MLEQPDQNQTGLTTLHASPALADTDISFDTPTETCGATATAGSRLQMLDLLQRCTKMCSSATQLDEVLFALAALAKEAVAVDLCLVMLVDQEHRLLTVQASSLDLYARGMSVRSLELDGLPLNKLLDLYTRDQLPMLHISEREQLDPLENVEYEALLIVPLLAGNECLGLVNCYSSKLRDYTVEEQRLLGIITSQASLAIMSRQLRGIPDHGNSVKAFFDDLLSEKPQESLRGRATFLGCDLTRPHSVLMLEISQAEESVSNETRTLAYKNAVRLVKSCIQERYPDSLCDERENVLYCIVSLAANDVTAGGLKTLLDDLARKVQSEQRLHMHMGVSNICHDINGYRQGLAEAQEALKIGQCLHADASSMYFSDLGCYRYVYAFARTNNLPDLYLSQIETIADYDQHHKRSELLHTLEVLLELGGRINEASERLAIHRNTLIQRVERIQSLCTVKVDQHSNRLPLQVALMIYRLRQQHTFG